MADATRFDIIIAGGGITGLTLARLLAGSGLDIAVIEQAELPPLAPGPELRVSAINRASLAVFERCGVLPALLAERATAFEQMHVWDATGAGEIHFDSAEMGLETLGYIIENHRIQHVLAGALATAADVTMLCPATIAAIDLGGAVRVDLEDGASLHCRLLVGADGIHSRVRAAAGFELSRVPYEQMGLVCAVATEHDHQHTAWQVFLPTGPLAFLPLFEQDGRRQCSIVWSLPEATARASLETAAADFIAGLEAAFQYRLGSLELVTQRAVFPLQHGHVDHYVAEGLALIGDAAHVIHPLAGQGANLGILDASALAGVVLAAGNAGRDWSARHTLRNYERDRKGENRLMETAMSGFNTLFSNDNPWLSMLRNASLNAVDQAPFVKQQFMRHAMGID